MPQACRQSYRSPCPPVPSETARGQIHADAFGRPKAGDDVDLPVAPQLQLQRPQELDHAQVDPATSPV